MELKKEGPTELTQRCRIGRQMKKGPPKLEGCICILHDGSSIGRPCKDNMPPQACVGRKISNLQSGCKISWCSTE